MKKYTFIPILFLLLTILTLGAIVIATSKGSSSPPDLRSADETRNIVIEKKVIVALEIPDQFVISQKEFVGQTFNNCGPASLSMIYSLLGMSVAQDVLAERLRPFNDPEGGVDDKSVFPDEIIKDASERGFLALERPNGTTAVLEKLIAQNIPVIVRTWLNKNEDIGHFRVVRGYDRISKTFLVDDSYNGPNITLGYSEFNSLWRPFNYSYIVIYPREKESIVRSILGSDIDEQVAWKNAGKRSEKDKDIFSQNVYSQFNILTSEYHLGNYESSVQVFEKIEHTLPPRMYWYQLEPIRAYLKIKNYDKVFEMTDSILNNGNLAYSELYEMRGDAYHEQGNKEAARVEYEKAIYYNKNFADKLKLD